MIFREKEIFEKKGAKIGTFLFLQGIFCHKVLQEEWFLPYFTNKMYFYHF